MLRDLNSPHAAAAPSKSCRVNYETFPPYGYGQNIASGRVDPPLRFITRQSLIVSQRDNGTGAPWAQGVCAELMETLPILQMSLYIQSIYLDLVLLYLYPL